MKRLRIQHTTRYTYHRAVRFHQHRLVLRPREGHDLQLESMHLRIAPDHHITWVRDIFGNSIALVDFKEDAAELEIVNEVVVERIAHFPTRTLHQPACVPYPVRYDPLETGVVAAYIAPSYPEDAEQVKSWLRENLRLDSSDTEGTMLALCQSIHDRMTYNRRSEKGVQSPVCTADLGTGSCRDFATFMMEAARSLGLAARFASGYLHGTASMAGHASTHAWTEVYLPDLGWRGFDPTMGQTTSLRHVVMGVSHHPRGVMPVTGEFAGTRADFKDLHVHVRTEEL
jgi:transglutaminase-like putative cysteine protease